MNVCTKFHSSPFTSCWDISIKSTKNKAALEDWVSGGQTNIVVSMWLPWLTCKQMMLNRMLNILRTTALNHQGWKTDFRFYYICHISPCALIEMAYDVLTSSLCEGVLQQWISAKCWKGTLPAIYYNIEKQIGAMFLFSRAFMTIKSANNKTRNLYVPSKTMHWSMFRSDSPHRQDIIDLCFPKPSHIIVEKQLYFLLFCWS